MHRLAIPLAILLVTSAEAAPKRRAVRVPPPIDQSTPAGWLMANASHLAATDFVPYSHDLAPLRAMIGEADVVALGDATHGTHEFYTLKLRLLDFLVREMGFEVLAIEAPFPLFNDVNEYVQGGPGNPGAALTRLRTLGYPFWDAQELLALIEWMREYNAHRGSSPPVVIAGMDVVDHVTAADEVLEYLRAVDPPYAAVAEEQYLCVRGSTISAPACYQQAAGVRDALASREAELTARSSTTAFHDALQHARVVVQSQYPYGPNRDLALAQNALWIREHRGTRRKIAIWAHNEHVAEAPSEWAGEMPMGRALANDLGPEYFSIATLTGSGSFLRWNCTAVDTLSTVPSSFPSIEQGSYESYFTQSGASSYVLPMNGTLPEWLTAAKRYNTAGTCAGPKPGLTASLTEKFDAAIYVAVTTPLQERR